MCIYLPYPIPQRRGARANPQLDYINMSDTFVQPAAERALLVAKAERKAALRAEYNKQITNPFRHATGEGGTVVGIVARDVLDPIRRVCFD